MWKMTKYGSFIGGFLLLMTFFLDSAPQQAALAAVAIGFAVIPYCMARANAEIKKQTQQNNEQETTAEAA